MAQLKSKTWLKFKELESKGKAYSLTKDESKEIKMRIGLDMENIKDEYKQLEIQSRALAAEYEIGFNFSC